MTEDIEMIKAIANDSKVRINMIVDNYEELEKENAELKKQLEMAEQVASDTPNLFIENCNLKAENAELKAKLKGFESGDVAWQGDMDATIKQNIELKLKIDELTNSVNELKRDNIELKSHCKAVDEVNEKMKCCENCVRHKKRTCDEDKKFFARVSRNCNEWELAE